MKERLSQQNPGYARSPSWCQMLLCQLLGPLSLLAFPAPVRCLCPCLAGG